jgi:hypothetical protein
MRENVCCFCYLRNWSCIRVTYYLLILHKLDNHGHFNTQNMSKLLSSLRGTAFWDNVNDNICHAKKLCPRDKDSGTKRSGTEDLGRNVQGREIRDATSCHSPLISGHHSLMNDLSYIRIYSNSAS